MTTAILIPSLNRPQRIRRTALMLRENTPEKHKVYWCVSDLESKNILFEIGGIFVDDSEIDDHRYVTRMNKLVRLIDDEDTIFFGSDDVIYHPGWLREAQRALRNDAGVVVVNDLRNRNGTQALIDRDYLELAVFDAPGDAFHAGYRHNFADTEQFFTAHKRGRYARAMTSYVEHLHPIWGRPNSLEWDTTYELGVIGGEGYEADRVLFEARAKLIDEQVSPSQPGRAAVARPNQQ